MQISNTGETNKDMGYTPPAPGRYVWQISEGMKIADKENGDGVNARSLQIPIEIVRVIEGDAEEGDKATYFINGINTNDMGERRLNELLIWTGQVDEFAKHFKGDVKDLIMDEKFVNKLYLKLLNSTFEATHNFREWEGKKIFNVTNMGVVSKKTSMVNTPASEPAAADTSW